MSAESCVIAVAIPVEYAIVMVSYRIVYQAITPSNANMHQCQLIFCSFKFKQEPIPTYFLFVQHQHDTVNAIN